jgi:hypothetical protein
MQAIRPMATSSAVAGRDTSQQCGCCEQIGERGGKAAAAREEHIYATLTDGSTEDVWGMLDPDKHPSVYLHSAVRELVSKKRGWLPADVGVARVDFDPSY